VCDCPQQTHYNYNSDQLLKVFHLVGSPSDAVKKEKIENKNWNPDELLKGLHLVGSPSDAVCVYIFI
jgi:hypothetical protein